MTNLLRTFILLLTFILVGCGGGGGGSSSSSPTQLAAPQATTQANVIALIANDPSKAANNLATLQAGINAAGVNGDTVFIPCGFYYIAPGITIGANQKSITISGCTNGMGYESLVTSNTNYSGGTVLYFSSFGQVGFDMSNTSGAGTYTRMTNLVISGGGSVVACLKIAGQVLLDHMNVQDCKNKAIWLYELVNGTSLDYVSATNNIYGEGYGLFVGSGVATLNDNTKFSVAHSAFRQNNVGMQIEQADGYSVTDTVIESNNREGLVLGRIHTGTGHGRNTNGYFLSVWLENNGVAADMYPNIKIDATLHSQDVYDTPSYIVFENVTSVSYPSTAVPGTFKQNVIIACGQYVDFRNSSIQTADPLVDGLAKAMFVVGVDTSYDRWYNVQGNYTVSNSGFMNSF